MNLLSLFRKPHTSVRYIAATKTESRAVKAKRAATTAALQRALVRRREVAEQCRGAIAEALGMRG